ncbi:MAG: hypothetical protein OXD36_12435 [Rhodobacter sp.]|nr:hypothetical protein [Rhodobacter sp.]
MRVSGVVIDEVSFNVIHVQILPRPRCISGMDIAIGIHPAIDPILKLLRFVIVDRVTVGEGASI